MPELPEVETIKRGLSKRLDGRTIIDIDVLNEKSFIGDKDKIIKSKIDSIERRAKVIRFKLSNGLNLLFHLKLTGQLIWRKDTNSKIQETNEKIDYFAGGHPSHDWSVSAGPSHDWHNKLPDSTTRIVFTFDDKSKLFFNDIRKFGWCKVLTSGEIEKEFSKYGIEPFSKNFTAVNILVRTSILTNRKIKQVLMDQEIIAGIGNIYADELLFDAKISPLRKVKDITKKEWEQIISSAKKVLTLAITHGGTTDSDYVNADGKKGGMQDYLKVYHRQGKPCPNNCGGKIKQIRVGGRGTHYCETCQK